MVMVFGVVALKMMVFMLVSVAVIAVVVFMLVSVAVIAVVVLVLVGVAVVAVVVLVLAGMAVFAVMVLVLVGMPVVTMMMLMFRVVRFVRRVICPRRPCEHAQANDERQQDCHLSFHSILSFQVTHCDSRFISFDLYATQGNM